MDFKDHVRQMGERLPRIIDSILTEEATKNALIMPFLQALGYDVFNPLEVVPEYITDVGIKKGEKIDYAIMRDGVPVILVECKHHGKNLDLHDGQLLRYFHVSKARFGILTNGITYRFYTDLEQPNKMDEKPFLEFRIDTIKDVQVEELKKFHKSYFDVERIVETASALMYMNELRMVVQREINDPSDDFTRFFTKLVYQGSVTQRVLDQFKPFVRKTFTNYLNDVMNERLQLAMQAQDGQTPVAGSVGVGIALTSPSVVGVVEQASESTPATTDRPKIQTTPEELESFFTVKALLHRTIEPKRLAYRDGQTYFSILLDDNNRKPVCRLYYNGTRKYVGIFDAAKVETKHEVSSNDDLFGLRDLLRDSASHALASFPAALAGAAGPSAEEQPVVADVSGSAAASA